MKASKLVSTILVAGMLSACSLTGDKHTVYFNPGSSQLTQKDRVELMKVAKIAKTEDKHIKLIARSDNKGAKELNHKLAEKRALEVNQTLVKYGVEPMKIRAVAKGEGWIDTEEDINREDRRVDIRVY